MSTQTISVTFTVEIRGSVTEEQIVNMVSAAYVQFSEPVDDEGEREVFDTSVMAVTTTRL